MDHRLPLRHLHAEVGLGEAAADPEDQVGLVQEVPHRLRQGEAARAQRQGVRLGEGALALEAGADRDRQQLRQLAQLVPGLRPMDTLAGIDHRPPCLHQHRRRLAHGLGIGAAAQRPRGRVVERLDLLVPDVDRDLDQHRPAAARPQPAERTPEDVGDLPGRGQGLGRLGDPLHLQGRVVARMHPGLPPRIAHRHDQHRHRFAVGLGDAAIGVLGPGPVLHAEGADLAPAGDARDRVRHVQAGPLLADDDRPDADMCRVLEHVVDRIADHPLHALTLQDLRDRVGRLQGRLPGLAAS